MIEIRNLKVDKSGLTICAVERLNIERGERVAVVDAFDAMLSSRSYRSGLPLGEALKRLKAGAGKQFDPRIVAQFINLVTKLLPELSTIEEFSSETPSLRVHITPTPSVELYGF